MRFSKLSTFESMKNLTPKNAIRLSDADLRELQRVILAALEDIDAYCEKKNIHYTLSGGSILGAFRHKGFIPWDDDIDLFMTRAEFDIFRESFGKDNPFYYLETPYTHPEIGIPISRIRIKGTSAQLYNDLSKSSVDGVPLDIFVLENTFDNAFLRQAHGYACLGVGFLQSCRRFFRDRKDYLALDDGGSMASTIRIKATIGAAVSFLSVSQWTRFANYIYSLCKKNDSKYVSCPSGRKHYFGEMYLRQDMEPVRTADFEGRVFPVPKNSQKYLEVLYGDWQEIPSPEERETHAYLTFDLGDARRASVAGEKDIKSSLK